MPKKKMHVSFLLDQTGSMHNVKASTISAFNEYIQSLQADPNAKGVLFTLTMFNSDEIKLVHEGVKMEQVIILNDQNYRPASTTPLYDAIGRTIRSLESTLQGKEKALVIIQTDGLENASREFTREGIFALIKEKRDSGWAFAFMGADIDAYVVGVALGVDKGSTLSYASGQESTAMRRVGAASITYTASGGTKTSKLFSDDDD